MTSFIRSVSIMPLSPGNESPSFADVSGPYEGNVWLRPAPPRFSASVVFEWEGDPPQEIKDLIARMETGR